MLLHLAERAARVILLEGAGIGFGGSGRNVGLVNAGMWVMPSDLPAALGAEHGERLLALLGDAPRAVFELIEKHQIACEPERAGTLHCAVGAAGMRELQLWDVSQATRETFDDIAALAGDCHFTDCQHRDEPRCAVKQAVAEGRLPAERLASYVKLQTEMEAYPV